MLDAFLALQWFLVDEADRKYRAGGRPAIR